MKMLILTDTDGDSVLVFPEYVIAVQEAYRENTVVDEKYRNTRRLYCKDKVTFLVKETLEHIKQELEEL